MIKQVNNPSAKVSLKRTGRSAIDEQLTARKWIRCRFGRYQRPRGRRDARIVAVHWAKTITTGLLRYLMSIRIPHLNRLRRAERIISQYGFFTALHTQVVGSSSSKRIHTHLETLTHALTFAKDMIISHIRQLQRCVISTMAMINRDDRNVEIRVRLLLLLNARESEMCGVWRGALLQTRGPDLWLRRTLETNMSRGIYELHDRAVTYIASVGNRSAARLIHISPIQMSP